MTSLSIPPVLGGYPIDPRSGEAAQLEQVARRFPADDRTVDFAAVRRSIHARAARARYFNAALFADPAWDMLLELYATELAGRRITVSKLAQRSGVPMTTALRWMATLEVENLIARNDDRFDGRRVFVALSRQGLKAMQAYFDALEADAPVV